MRIQCTVPRPREVELGNQVYKFAQDDEGRFVANVTIKPHIDRLLSIDVYRNLDAEPEPDVEEPELNDLETGKPPKGKAKTPAKAPAKAPAKVEEPEDDDGQDDGSDAGTDDHGDDSADDSADDSNQDADHDELVAQYQAKFGKKPHHKLSDDRIREVLAEA